LDDTQSCRPAPNSRPLPAEERACPHATRRWRELANPTLFSRQFTVNRLNRAELAGPSFSPDGKILFVNIFGGPAGTVSPYTGAEGMTIAITGPWGKGPL
jgi:hypothetical protein